MSKKRLSHLIGQLDNKPQHPAEHSIIANKPHGQKSDHIKITVTLPPEVYKIISDAVAKRKMLKRSNPNLSAVIREAIVSAAEKDLWDI